MARYSSIIEEGLRMFPSSLIGFVRAVPTGGDTVSGHFIPEGTTVSVYKLEASNPFSLGLRGCIGRNLSYMEMRLIIAKPLWHNNIEMTELNKKWNLQGDYKNMVIYNNWIKPGLNLKLTPRKS
ncbi:cytochrome P450 [Glonium stellatum]|uniref:Cytochrome P450 n=1 Tax=Glonium stellatum TaxID=574774 RepID=A0A8E2F5B5_9PEZI|nr:cytochrome P450 [Glonium stellatum]